MQITYEAISGEAITLKQLKPYFLTEVDGTGSIAQSINTFKAPNQDGAFFISGTLNMRNITLEGVILTNKEEDAFKYRQRLLHVFSPKTKGMLIYRNKRIPALVEEVMFTQKSSKRPSFLISLLCPSPFFEAIDELRVELAAWRAKFSFLLEIPETGMEFGVREPSQIITVDNDGDVPCGCSIKFKALASVTNPELMNVDTGEYMRILKNMEPNEQMIVDTCFAAKRVTSMLGSTKLNAFPYVDTSSTFLQLNVGRNTLRYSAQENMDMLEVTILFRAKYLGV